MKRFIAPLLLVGIIGLFAPSAANAAGISYDNAVSTQANTVTNSTYSFTVGSCANRVLILGVQFGGSTDVSGTPTYNGVSMTQVGTYSVAGTTFAAVRVYSLVAPASGSHNVSISNTGGANYIYSSIASYCGVDQTTPVETSGTAGPTTNTSLSKSLTTTTSGDWLVGFFSGGSTGASLSAGSNTTFRTTVTGGSWNNIGDTNGPQSPAGTYSIAVSAGASEKLGIFALALKPAAGASFAPWQFFPF